MSPKLSEAILLELLCQQAEGSGQRDATAQISLPQLGVVHHHAAFSPGAANEEE